jgi:hypothetical protein
MLANPPRRIPSFALCSFAASVAAVSLFPSMRNRVTLGELCTHAAELARWIHQTATGGTPLRLFSARRGKQRFRRLGTIRPAFGGDLVHGHTTDASQAADFSSRVPGRKQALDFSN